MPRPHDELLDQNHRILSRRAFWTVQVNDTGVWRSLLPVSDDLTNLGTNTTGSYVVRSMGVTTGPYGGLLRITYKALPSGRLNYDLEFTPTLTGDYRLSFSWENLTDKYSLFASFESVASRICH
jgi:hypothetical protein